ncbi:MAG: hypothetical protein LBG42_03750 [Treponema sp.]|jgi:hypothetical protein|nr:hypothetical protein [Treponema sp.]
MEQWLCNLVKQAKCTPLDAIGIVLSLFALGFAWFIPRRIMVNQMYANLVQEYRTAEMGTAILAIFYFFAHDCNNNVSNIHRAYIDKYKKQVTARLSEKIDLIDFSRTLHFQRRQLAQFYSDMAMLRYNYRFLGLSKRKIQKESCDSLQKSFDINIKGTIDSDLADHKNEDKGV